VERGGGRILKNAKIFHRKTGQENIPYVPTMIETVERAHEPTHSSRHNMHPPLLAVGQIFCETKGNRHIKQKSYHSENPSSKTQ
jgi:hypothetical protein